MGTFHLFNKKIVLFIFILGLPFHGVTEDPPTPAPAPIGTFTCKSEIRYSWQPNPKEKDPPNTEAKSIEVTFAIVETKGASEESAKEVLSQRIATERTNATNRCRHTHENLAGCISTKYASMTSVLNALSFSARGELEKAVADDCGHQTGRCLNTTSSPAECVFAALPTPTPDPKAAEAAGKKDKKKK